MASIDALKYTLEYSHRAPLVKRDYYWILGVWVGLLVWAALESSYTILIPPLVITAFVLLPLRRSDRYALDIVVSDDALRISRGEAVLWGSLPKEITSIELEEKGFFQFGARRALIIRTSRNDSYYLSLDGMTFADQPIKEVLAEIRSVWKKRL